MRVTIAGTVVERERNDWSMNGNSGTAYSLFLRGDSLRDSAQKVRVEAEQYGGFSEGDVVELPVDVFANVNDRGTARLTVRLAPEYQPGQRAAA